ncbi:MAG: hypothetical protein RL701_7963 [Pseudomonadota bacterium]
MTPCHRDLTAVQNRIVRVLCALACWLGLTLACEQASGQVHAVAGARTWTLGRLILAQPQLSAADAEARNTTMARALFDEGLRFVDMENWRDAEDRFSRVLTLRYSAVAAYNLGLAQARLGRGVVASAALRRLLTDPNLDVKVRDRASELLSDVEGRFAWLNVRVLGECRGCSVYLNDEEWPWAVVGVYVPVDAGKYTLRLHSSGHVLSEERLEIAQTARVEASLFATRAALEAAQRAGSLAATAESTRAELPVAAGGANRRRTSITSSGWFWGAMGMLLVGATAAILLETQ